MMPVRLVLASLPAPATGPASAADVSVSPGETGRFPVTESSTRCNYSLRFVLEDGRELVDAADICDAPSYRLEDAR